MYSNYNPLKGILSEVFHFDVLLLKAPDQLVVLNLRCSKANGSVVEQISTLPHQNKFSNLLGGLYLIIVSVVVITLNVSIYILFPVTYKLVK